VAIIGAGPYGLSVAAHLSGLGVQHRIIGHPMHEWVAHMPKGMLLKSEGFASSLYDPDGFYPLQRFCVEQGVPYADMGAPVSIEVFIAYSLAFQARYVPHLEPRLLASLHRSGAGFRLQLDDGTSFHARRVVLAVGIEHFAHMPESLGQLPASLRSHSSRTDVTAFKGRDVTVIGAGASAVDLAAFLHEHGAKTRLAARRPTVRIHGRMQLPRPFRDRIVRPMSTIGPSWWSCFFCAAPHLFRHLPLEVRLRLVRTRLGPSGGWFMRERVLGRVPILAGYQLREASPSPAGVTLRFETSEGSIEEMTTEHVVAATGYRSDLRRLPFLNAELLSQIRTVLHTPVLTAQFQSSVPGLYFIGPVAANSFGPVMRFAVGARFTARRIARHLAAPVRRGEAASPLVANAASPAGALIDS
jgi:thioredoxin reductase